MPRIRGINALVPAHLDAKTHYKNINSLFGDAINWKQNGFWVFLHESRPTLKVAILASTFGSAFDGQMPLFQTLQHEA